MALHYFLGANGGKGFQSVYETFLDPERNYDMMVLKGGPGVGKSSFMKYIAKKAETAGEKVEYIWCSGDPDSLDAIRLPRVGVLAVDGTSPHVVEPRYPVAVDRYVDLGRFYSVSECKEKREEIIKQTDCYKDAYGNAYRSLEAAAAVEETVRRMMMAGLDRHRMEKRAAGIAARELKKDKNGNGEISYRYLGGPTCKGMVRRFDTVAVQCRRVYEIRDSYGLSGELLQILFQRAKELGHTMTVCPSPNQQNRIEHLLLPELGVAFVTIRSGVEYPFESYRRFHMDYLVDDALRKQNRARLRFHKRVYEALMSEAVFWLEQAKKRHDRLEELYNGAVDFDGVYAQAEIEWERIGKIL